MKSQRNKGSEIFNSDLFIVETRNGMFSLKVIGDDGDVRVLHSLYDPEAEARTIVDAFQFNGRGILVVLGLGLGYHLAELLRRFPDATIIVVEELPEIFELAKERGRISEIKDKVQFIVGSTPEDVIENITSLQIKTGMPSLTVFALTSAVSASPKYYRSLLAVLKNAMSVRLWERLRYPKFKEEVIKVALIDYGYFLTREVEKAIQRLGHMVVKIPVRKGENGEIIVSRLMKSILEFKHDFFLTINHLGFDEEGILSSFFTSLEMPVASWYVDSPNIIIRTFYKNVSPYVSLFLWDRGYREEMVGIGFENVEYLPLATDEMVFKSIPLRSSEIRKYRADVGFVGSSMVESTNEELEKLPQELHPLAEKMARVLIASRMPFDKALKTLDEYEKVQIPLLAIQERIALEAAAIWRATLLYRLECMKALREFHPVIHGDAQWKELLNSGYTLRPQLHYYRELPLFYNACKTNFNATSLQMLGAVNQRVFDVPACGSFLLTDYQRDLDELFTVGEEVIVYKDKEEIPELVRFYLNNPGERETVARKGRERVLKEHTYTHRLNSIINSMRNRYG